MSVADRYRIVRALMAELFDAAENADFNAPDAEIEAALDDVFSTTSRGFREILLVVVIARLQDPTYAASTGLYDCHPRALYEGPIADELRSRGIPHGKSGPLNIAKAAQGLTEEWAAQRRPAAVGFRVVELVAHIESIDEDELWDFAVELHRRFLEEASRVAGLTVSLAPESNPALVHALCWHLIETAPDGGNTAQRVFGLALKTYHDFLQTGITVEGYEDSASVTSTTSKKPGDVSEVLLDGAIASVFEVTTKGFNAQRVRESYDTVRAYDATRGTETLEVQVVCRAQDVHGEAVIGTSPAPSLGRLEYEDLVYEFIDLSSWLMARTLAMPPDARVAFHEALSDYVNDFNTSEKVKAAWASF